MTRPDLWDGGEASPFPLLLHGLWDLVQAERRISRDAKALGVVREGVGGWVGRRVGGLGR